MKKIFAITIALIGFIFSACNDWLDVNPRTQSQKRGFIGNTERVSGCVDRSLYPFKKW